jgi:hypothetical protein
VLLNFNADIFMRCAHLVKRQAIGDVPEWRDAEWADEPIDLTGVLADRLDRVVGGKWWQEIVMDSSLDYPDKVERLVWGVCDRLRRRFAEVCFHSVFAKAKHRVPKYVLVFGSRSGRALEYMNDAMITARNTLADASAPAEPTLYETRSESLVPDPAKLPALLRVAASRRYSRKELVREFIRQNFCRNTAPEIRDAIERARTDGWLRASSTKNRLGDDDEVWIDASDGTVAQ